MSISTASNEHATPAAVGALEKAHFGQHSHIVMDAPNISVYFLTVRSDQLVTHRMIERYIDRFFCLEAAIEY